MDGELGRHDRSFSLSLPHRAGRGRPYEADCAEQREGDELPHRRDHPRRAPPLVVLVRRLEVDLHIANDSRLFRILLLVYQRYGQFFHGTRKMFFCDAN
jgi:hypothetical protein